MKIEGGCLCGKVRYSADAEPIFVGVCHCKNCQKQAGTAFSVIFGIPKPALSLQGTLSRTSRNQTGSNMFHPRPYGLFLDDLPIHIRPDLPAARVQTQRTQWVQAIMART